MLLCAPFQFSKSAKGFLSYDTNTDAQIRRLREMSCIDCGLATFSIEFDKRLKQLLKPSNLPQILNSIDFELDK